MRFVFAVVTLFVGWAMIVAGLGLWFPPVALVVGGVLLGVAPVLWFLFGDVE